MDTRVLATTALTLLALAAPASAATRYAEPGGNGPEPCEAIDPCDIQIAVEGTTGSSVQAGDEVILAPGQYAVGSDGPAEIDITKAIDVHGQGGSRPTIVSGANVGVYLGSSGGTLRGVRIEHTGAVAALFLDSGTVDGVAAHTSGAGFQYGCLVVRGLVRNSVCWNTAAAGSALGSNYSTGVHAITLRGVTAISTAATSSYGVSFTANAGNTTTVSAKGLIADGMTADVQAAADGSSSNSFVLDHSNYATAESVAPATVTPAGTGGNQTDPPSFVDAANGDFRQIGDSVTVNAGALDGSSGSEDFEGDPRTLGPAPDIGADEYIPPPPDGDGDGVPDASDDCPSEAGPAANGGCPVVAPPVGPPVETPVGETPPVDKDADPPETQILKGPGKRTAKARARIEFVADEAVARFECRVDRGDFASCTSPFKKRMAAGRRHRFEVRAIDAAGNVDQTPARLAWKVLAG